MESLVKKNLFNNIFFNTKVFVTGHTGFKGSWLCLWLEMLGAKVMGYSLLPPTNPNHFELLNLNLQNIIGDVRDQLKLTNSMKDFSPDIVFHLAAQPLVRQSYLNPIETMETNIMGSLNVYEAIRKTPSVKALVSITTDKVYNNIEKESGYTEDDELGGKDPYSASKAAMEIITYSYRHSFFNPDKYEKDHNVLISTVRAGNVIGGGDWAADRLIPDIIKSTAKGQIVKIRNPNSTRPWQHVLEPLSGYLLIGQRLLERNKNCAEAFNLGPQINEDISVLDVIKIMKTHWNNIKYELELDSHHPYEAKLLKLDCTKIEKKLDWKPIWDVNISLQETSKWYRSFYDNRSVLSKKNILDYIDSAQSQKSIWSI